MKTFQDLSLPAPLQEALVRMQYHEPTEIQAKAIPLALEGHDILGSAQTGTGKTAAFAIPLVNKLIEDKEATALILTPTRELAEQVITVLHQLLNKRRDIKTALLIGGMPIFKQLIKLKENPRVIVGTPGRINDHLARRSISFKTARILVLDEADRMLDMGFGVQLEEIAKHLPSDRQTFMFSATLPKRILSLSEKFLNNPQRVKVGATYAPLTKIKQDIIRTSEEKKFDSLLKELDKRDGSIIVFAKTKRKVDLLAKRLKEKVTANAMHGDLRQQQRTRILKEFREQKYRILVATDVAARGLDIPHIQHVINYDLPQAPEDYIHRIGRTARGSAEGSALCFISREDEKNWRAIERLLGGDESAPAIQPRRPMGNHGKPRSGFGAPKSGQKPTWKSKSRYAEKDATQKDTRGRPYKDAAQRDTRDRPYKDAAQRDTRDRPYKDAAQRDTRGRPYKDAAQRDTRDRPYKDAAQRDTRGRPYKDAAQRDTRDRPYKDAAQRDTRDRPYKDAAQRNTQDKPYKDKPYKDSPYKAKAQPKKKSYGQRNQRSASTTQKPSNRASSRSHAISG